MLIQSKGLRQLLMCQEKQCQLFKGVKKSDPMIPTTPTLSTSAVDVSRQAMSAVGVSRDAMSAVEGG